MFKKLIDNARLPERATRYSAGFDVFANENVTIGAGETKLIGLGIALDRDAIEEIGLEVEDIVSAHYFMLCLRSSLGVKGLILPNGHGVIDMDYQDEIKMIIHNPTVVAFPEKLNGYAYTGEPYEIKKGDKIGQLILCRHEGWLLPDKYTLDADRAGGFGSTGQ